MSAKEEIAMQVEFTLEELNEWIGFHQRAMTIKAKAGRDTDADYHKQRIEQLKRRAESGTSK